MGRPQTSGPSTRALSWSRRPTPAVEPERPQLPPIEQVAADVRRLRRMLEALPPGTSFVRTIGVAHAYDVALDMACTQLEVSTRLLDLPDGRPRILERNRLEYVLADLGLNL